MITPADLNQFTGTTHWHRYRPRLLLTDGTHFLARELNCCWLLDLVWSVLPQIRRAGGFAIVELKTDLAAASAVVTIHDGGRDGGAEQVIHRQAIPYTDFPWPVLMLYVGPGDENDSVLLLPSEY